MNPRQKVRALAQDSLAKGDALGWFERVYDEAAGREDAVPWADLVPNDALVDWVSADGDLVTPRGRRTLVTAPGRRALVVGCGLGDDAEWLAAAGADVVAFDIAPSAVAWATQRHRGSKVRYEVRDLLAPPADWAHAFDFVFEAYTLQALPPELRARAAAILPTLVAPDGALLIVARGADAPSRIDDGPPGR